MWHVVHTAPNTELQVSRVLEMHGLRTCVPQFRPARRTRPGSVRDRRHRWIFPGYVFFQRPDGFSAWQLVRSAPGVRRVLEQDGEPARLDDAVVDHLEERVAAMRADWAGGIFRPGQRVIVDRGPLAMVDALFEHDLPARERVTILVRLLGRLVSVEVDPQVLRAAG